MRRILSRFPALSLSEMAELSGAPNMANELFDRGADQELEYLKVKMLDKINAEQLIAEKEKGEAEELERVAIESVKNAKQSVEQANRAADLAQAEVDVAEEDGKTDNGTVSANTTQLAAKASIEAENTYALAVKVSIEAANTLTRSPVNQGAKTYDNQKVSVNTLKIEEAAKSSEKAAESAKEAALAALAAARNGIVSLKSAAGLAQRAFKLAQKSYALAEFTKEYAIGLKGLASLYKINSGNLLLALNKYIDSLERKDQMTENKARNDFITESRRARDANHQIFYLDEKYKSNLDILGIKVTNNKPQKGGRTRRKRKTKRRKNKKK